MCAREPTRLSPRHCVKGLRNKSEWNRESSPLPTHRSAGDFCFWFKLFTLEAYMKKPIEITVILESALGKAIWRELADIRDDIDAICERDPAARSRTEVLLLYSGLHALIMHRIAAFLHKHNLKFSARAVSQLAKFFTGIEIHPGAKIGKGVFIDHGAGVVIGETAVVGDNCTIYQGVTLGGTGKETGKRHPTLGNNVMIGAGAKLLGGFTVGSNSKIAAGAVVLSEVPENCTAVGIPAHVVRKKGQKLTDDLDQVNIPDPVENELNAIRERLLKLEEKLKEKENE